MAIDHDWLEGRGPRCTLMVLIDDATGQIALYMAEAETTLAALTVLHKWVKMHGVPVSIYADRPNGLLHRGIHPLPRAAQ